MTAVDAMLGGFSQQGIWVGVNGDSAARRWIETGVTQGADLVPGVPADIYRYFTGYGEGDDDVTWILPGTPTIGQVQYFKVVNSGAYGTLTDLGCAETNDAAWYRTPELVWSVINNLHWKRTYIAKSPSPSSVHGSDCCNGLITAPGSTQSECVAPKDIIYFLNSQTPTDPAQACN